MHHSGLLHLMEEWRQSVQERIMRGVLERRAEGRGRIKCCFGASRSSRLLQVHFTARRKSEPERRLDGKSARDYWPGEDL